MNCKKCNGLLISVSETEVQCENCGARYRLKPKVKTEVPANEPETTTREIDHTKPFSDESTRAVVDSILNETSDDTLNRTFDDDIKSRAVLNSVEPDVNDYVTAQDVNDVITAYEQENYPETREIKEKIYCSNCSKPVDLETGVCPNCGTVMPLPEKMTLVCPFCFYDKNNKYSEFCFKCGRDLEPERTRLGIVLKQREHGPAVAEAPKKKSDSDEEGEVPVIKKFLNFFGIIIAIIEMFVLFTFDFVANSELSIKFAGLIEVIQGEAESNLITDVLSNQILSKILGLVILLFIASIVAYVFGSIYFILIKKSIMNSLTILSVITMISNMVLLVVCEYVSFKALGGIKIEMFSPIINLAGSILVMLISFMII